jgi:hypothetical protein
VGRRTAVSRYAWPLVAEKLEHLYTELAAAKTMRLKVRR